MEFFLNNSSQTPSYFRHLFLEGVAEDKPFFCDVYSSDVALHFGATTFIRSGYCWKRPSFPFPFSGVLKKRARIMALFLSLLSLLQTWLSFPSWRSLFTPYVGVGVNSLNLWPVHISPFTSLSLQAWLL